MAAAVSSKRRSDQILAVTVEDDLPAAKKSRAMPTAYTPGQKTLIQQYIGLTQVDKSNAARALKAANWNVQTAVNTFFSSGTTNRADPHAAKLNKLFDSYREDAQGEPNEVNMEGMMKMMGDMGVDIESVDMFIFSELVGSPTLGKVTREGFVDGLSQEGVSDPTKISGIVASRRRNLKSGPVLKMVYKHTFTIAKAQGQKSVALDAALEYWRLLFSPPSLEWSTANTPWLDWWIEFLQEKWKKSVNKDMWDQTLAFADKTLQDVQMTFWSEDSAWPGVIDEFVAYVKDKRGNDAMDVS